MDVSFGSLGNREWNDETCRDQAIRVSREKEESGEFTCDKVARVS